MLREPGSVCRVALGGTTLGAANVKEWVIVASPSIRKKSCVLPFSKVRVAVYLSRNAFWSLYCMQLRNDAEPALT